MITRLGVAFVLATVANGVAQQAPLVPPVPLDQRIAHADPSKYRNMKAVHEGPGSLDYRPLFDAQSLETNLFFMHRGVIEPKSGIGAHFHNQCEEMFIILDGEAQFTIDGRTSTLKGPAGAPTRLGHSHAIYNATDKPVQWINFNVGTMKGVYDAFDLQDPTGGRPAGPDSHIHDHAPGSIAAEAGGTHGRGNRNRAVSPGARTDGVLIPHGRTSTMCFYHQEPRSAPFPSRT